MSSWVTHLCKGFEGFFFLGDGLQPGGHFLLFTGKSGPNWWAYKLGAGLKAVVYACARHSGIGEGAKRTKLKKIPAFLMLYFSPSEYLERFIISYIAVLSYLEQ